MLPSVAAFFGRVDFGFRISRLERFCSLATVVSFVVRLEWDMGGAARFQAKVLSDISLSLTTRSNASDAALIR